MRFGLYDIQPVNFGYFRLDGGAMFGSVPKNLWSKRCKPDDENCIRLASRSLLLKSKGICALIDVGLGDKWSDKQRKIFDIQNTPREELPFKPEEITHIILTHLHFDHAGGISELTPDGQVELIYPNATVYLQAANWETAQAPNVKEKASYLPENVEPLKKAKRVLINGVEEVLPQVYVHQCDGHTEGQQWVEIINDETSLFFCTDLIPTHHHVPLAYHMGYDINAGDLLIEKEAFLMEAVRRKAILFSQHDPEMAAFTVKRTEEGGQIVFDREVLFE